MIGRILCLFGRHRWAARQFDFYRWQECERCLLTKRTENGA